MRQLLRWSLVLMLVLIPLTGCDKGGGTAEVEEGAWPDQPANGQPVVLEFVEMIGEGEDLGASMRVFNFGEQAVERLNMTLRYLNEAGEELETFPFSVSQPEIAAAGGQAGIEVGMFVPAETVRIEADLDTVNFVGGETWTSE